MAIDIGISEEDRKSIVEGLSRLLSDTYVLYLKTHNFTGTSPVRCSERCT